jgi:hypothetical protein
MDSQCAAFLSAGNERHCQQTKKNFSWIFYSLHLKNPCSASRNDVLDLTPHAEYQCYNQAQRLANIAIACSNVHWYARSKLLVF